MFFQGFGLWSSPPRPSQRAWRCRPGSIVNIGRWKKGWENVGKSGERGKIWGKDWNMCSENLKLGVSLEILGKSYGKLFEKAKFSWFLHYIKIISLVQNWTSGWLVALGVKTI